MQVFCVLRVENQIVRVREMPIKLPSHSHSLDLCERAGDEAANCQRCSEIIRGWAYGCRRCSYFLHIACVEIQSPFHPEHALTPGHLDANCQVCGSDVQFAFNCCSCDFHQCLNCLSVAPIARIERDGHPFFLIELEDTDNLIGCLVCGEVRIIGNYKLFKCMFPGCRDFFHVHCVPFDLPETVQWRYHPHHSLVFTEKYVKPHIIGCFCDECEKERDPESPVYSCNECELSVHVACALSKKLPDLIKKWETQEQGKSPKLVNANSSTEAVPNELKEKIVKLHTKNYYLTRELENTVEELNKVELERATYIVSAIAESMKKAMSKL